MLLGGAHGSGTSGSQGVCVSSLDSLAKQGRLSNKKRWGLCNTWSIYMQAFHLQSCKGCGFPSFGFSAWLPPLWLGLEVHTDLLLREERLSFPPCPKRDDVIQAPAKEASNVFFLIEANLIKTNYALKQTSGLSSPKEQANQQRRKKKKKDVFGQGALSYIRSSQMVTSFE